MTWGGIDKVGHKKLGGLLCVKQMHSETQSLCSTLRDIIVFLKALPPVPTAKSKLKTSVKLLSNHLGCVIAFLRSSKQVIHCPVVLHAGIEIDWADGSPEPILFPNSLAVDASL